MLEHVHALVPLFFPLPFQKNVNQLSHHHFVVRKLLYFVWSPPWHLYILLLANLLTFDLTYLLAFYLAFYLAYLLAFYLAYLLAYYLLKSSGILSGKHSGTLSGISSGILSDILSGILSGISSGISIDCENPRFYRKGHTQILARSIAYHTFGK